MLLLGACSKNSGSTPTPTPAATTYATTWTADGTNYTATTSTGAVMNGTLLIGATQNISSSESYSLTLGVPPAVGTYTLGTSTSGPNTITAGYGKSVGSANTNYTAASLFGSGAITVTPSSYYQR